jgi:TrmH family RNA methyltransferase
VTSIRSDRVTVVRALHARQGRRKAGRFLIEGPQSVRSAFAAGVLLHDLFVAEDTGGALSDLIDAARQAGVRLTWVTSPVMSAMAETPHPQGVLAIADLLPESGLDTVMSAPGPVIVLEAVSDPGNVGTVIRTADACGAAGVLLTPESADVHGGKVVRSTAGSLFHLPVVPAVPVADAVAAAHRHGRSVAVATGEATTDLFTATRSGEVTDRTCWIVGSEAHGVSQESRDLADVTIAIPMTGRAESLNAAVAAAVVLYVTWAAQNDPASP